MTGTVKRWFAAATVITAILMLQALDLRAEDARTLSPQPIIIVVEGSVKIMGQKSSQWEPARVGTWLISGDRIKTGLNSYSEIRFPSGKVQLYENSVLIVPVIRGKDSEKDIRKIVVEDGGAVFDINPQGVKRKFEFRTKNVQGGVKGTRFAVGYREKKTDVLVYEGLVEVKDSRSKLRKSTFLPAGTGIRVAKKSDFRYPIKFDQFKAAGSFEGNRYPTYDEIFRPIKENRGIKELEKIEQVENDDANDDRDDADDNADVEIDDDRDDADDDDGDDDRDDDGDDDRDDDDDDDDDEKDKDDKDDDKDKDKDK